MLTEQLYVGKGIHRKTGMLYNQAVTTTNARNTIGFLERHAVLFLMNLQVVMIACATLKRISLILKTLKRMKLHVETLWGGSGQKVQKINGSYYFHLYAPPWPSAARNLLIRKELLHLAFPQTYPEFRSFVFLAITRKCPLRCDHCYEWDNLGKEESFSLDELKEVVDYYQQQGAQQFYFSGGEPMVRFRDLLELIMHANKKSDCFVLTSGVNLTTENALLLKRSGCTGVEVSIDHYIPSLHNAFRHNNTIFQRAVKAVKASLDAGMITGLSVCATRDFIAGGHLEPYMEFAKDLGVHFVQVLEPKAVGHYAGKDILLEEQHMQALESFFVRFNNDPKFSTYPTVLYNGYHQRRIGCYTGSHSIYVDSAGDVHACPFCHTKSYAIKDILLMKDGINPVSNVTCPAYGNA